MKPTDENIRALARAVLKDARGDVEQIMADAKAKADDIRQRAQAQAAAERTKILEQASLEAERLRSQAIATTQLKARALELEHREKLLERVFRTARQQLPAVQQKKDYDQIAVQLLREALAQLNASKAQVRADKRTQKALTNHTLEEISREMKAEISFGKPLEQGIGVIVEAADGHLRYDNTLETRLDRLQNRLRSSVYRLLMGETS